MKFIGALLQISKKTKLRLVLISRKNLNFYDRRDVHTRKNVSELSLSGLTIEELNSWLDNFSKKETPSAEEIHSATGGHPLAVELLEIYGQKIHLMIDTVFIVKFTHQKKTKLSEKKFVKNKKFSCG